jgi:hypothetical protein
MTIPWLLGFLTGLITSGCVYNGYQIFREYRLRREPTAHVEGSGPVVSRRLREKIKPKVQDDRKAWEMEQKALKEGNQKNEF